MGLLLDITGTLELEFLELNGVQNVTENRRKDIEDKLKSGDYIIGLSTGCVRSLPNLEVVAKFKFYVCNDIKYSFSGKTVYNGGE